MNIMSMFRSWTSSSRSGSSKERTADHNTSKNSEMENSRPSRFRPTAFSSVDDPNTSFHPMRSKDSDSDIKLVIQRNQSFELNEVKLDEQSREIYSPPLFLSPYTSRVRGGRGEDHFGGVVRGYSGQHAF
jgi:hypothetical protein